MRVYTNMTTKLLDASGSLAARRDISFARRFEATFYNTGNILYFDALKKHIPSAVPVYGWEDLADPCELAIISMANFINPHTDVTAEAETLRKSKVEKIVLIGCGAQASSYDESFMLRPDTKNFLSIISERSKSIGVRGEYTAELLNRNGFKNVRVIGCPSFFASGSVAPQLRRVESPKKIAFGATPSGDYRHCIKELYSYGMSTDAVYITQAESELLGLFSDQPSEEQLRDVEFFTNYYCPASSSPEQFKNWLKSKTKMFFELDHWHEFMSDRDLYLGTRIHGSVAAVQSGCPALTLVIDSRTRELCEFFNYPFLDFERFDARVDVNLYYEAADFTNFEVTYRQRLENYVEFLSENEIPNVLAGGVTGRVQNELRALSVLNIGDAVRVRHKLRSYSDATRSAGFSAYQAAIIQCRETVLVTAGVAPHPNYNVEEKCITASMDDEASQIEEGITPMTEIDITSLRGEVMEARRVFSEAVSNYVRLSGANPEFLLGVDVRPTSIAPDKLKRCEVLSDRYKIIEKMPNRGNVAEVGTQTGLFAKHILSVHDQIKLSTIDIDYSLFQRDQLSEFIEAGRLTTIKGSSWDELSSFPEAYFSWIYIDASHFYDDVKRDLEAAKDRVEIGGYIICNDYTNWSPFEAENYGVLQAVNEFVGKVDFEVSHFAFHPFGYNDIALKRLS